MLNSFVPWDFCVVLHKDNAINMSVTFAAVKEQIAKKHLSLFEEAGLKVSTLEPAPFSMVRLLTLGKQLVKEKPTAIIDVDFGMADINIVKDKICYLTRDVSLPLKEELIFDNLMDESPETAHVILDGVQKDIPVSEVKKSQTSLLHYASYR